MSGDSETVGGSSTGRGGRFGRGGQYRGRGGTRPSRTRFIGGSADMLGYVFQVNGEQRKRGQFKNTLDMLRIYTSKNMQKEMDMISCLFDDNIIAPEVLEPDEPEVKSGKDELTKAQVSIFNERINFFIKEERILRSATMALYNVTWRQCSPMMQNRLESSVSYIRIKSESKVTSLLIEIKGVSNELEASSNVYDAIDEAK